MAELTADDVEQYTRGRLQADDDTAILLSDVLAAARRYCGWHVSPVIEETLELDGDGGRVLSLPTLKIVTLSELVEDGVEIPVGDLLVSKRRGLVRKRSGRCWSCHYGAIEVTMTHGFTEEEAADWRLAVLASVDLADRAVSHGAFRAIGPFQYGSSASVGQGSRFGESELATFDAYRIMLAP